MEHDGRSSLGLEESIVAAASYLWFLGVILFLLEKRSNFVRFHAMQSTLAFGVLTSFGLIVAWTPVLHRWFWWLPGGIMFVFSLIMMAKSWYGEEHKLPVIGPIAFNAIYHTGPDLEDVLAEPADQDAGDVTEG